MHSHAGAMGTSKKSTNRAKDKYDVLELEKIKTKGYLDA